MIRAIGALSLVIAAVVPARAQVAVNAVLGGRIGIEDRLEEPSLSLATLSRLPNASNRAPVFVRLSAAWTTLERASMGDWSVLDDRLGAYERRGLPIVLAIGPREGLPADTDASVQVIRSVVNHLRGRVTAYQVEAPVPRPVARDYAFQLKLVSVQIKATDPRTAVAQATTRSSDLEWLTDLYAEGIGPYVDLAVLAVANDSPETAMASTAMETLVAARDPSAGRLQVGALIDNTAPNGAARLLATMFARLGEPASLGTTFTGSVDDLVVALSAALNLADLFSGTLVTIDDTAVALALEAQGRNITTSVPHRVFQNVATGGMYIVYWDVGRDADPLSISVVDQSGRSPVVRDPWRPEVVRVQSFSWNATTHVSRMTSESSRPLVVIDFNYGAASQLTSRAEVRDAALLSVDEIVARHQQAQAVQTNAFKTFVASLSLELHFRPTSTQVFDVVSENRFFFAPDAVEWEERSFSVNGTRWGPDRPGLPLLQAEKVLSLPLDLHLTMDYRYRLEKMESVAGRSCYVVEFEPTDLSQSRYRGRVWIDASTFLRIKVQSVQTHLEGSIVSSEEVAVFGPIETGRGAPLWLPARLSTKQTLLIAGRNVLLEKEQRFSDFRVDSPDFESERRAARSGKQIMFRDTPVGIRYLVKRGEDRVVSSSVTTTSKAMAMGTTVDPTFAFPLPILGLNYLNFDFKGTGSQVAVLFGGVFALGNLQATHVGGTPLDASVDFFGFAVPGTDLQFDQVGERKDERVLSIPMSTGLNLGYQFTPFQRVSGGYTLRYDAYFRAPDTAAGFVVPRSSITQGGTLAYEYSRHGYKLGGTASMFSRSSWEKWGPNGDVGEINRTYRRHSVSIAKDVLFGPFQSVHTGVAWYGGARLDRFSMYQFGLFDEVRMHGVPSAGIRFPELVLARGSYSFNVLGLYRLDLFIDHARGRDPNNRSLWRPVTGTGAALTVKAPWNTMFTADVGKSVIPGLYRGTGSFVVQIMLLKPL